MSNESPSAAAGQGLATVDEASGATLDAWYPAPALGLEPPPVAGLPAAERRSEDRGVRLVPVATVVHDLQVPPADAADAYLRLHLLSHRLVRPRTVNLDGVFGVLANVAWTSLGPVSPERLDALRLQVRAAAGHLGVYGVDKFPRMTDYVVPSGVRIADADRVRLGAHLAEGTTVMHEGFVNYNAGTLGTSMVEGRISAGVVVGDGSDVGGGASIMGTLSGGGREVIAVGARLPAGCELRPRDLARRPLRRRGRPLRHGRHAGAPAGRERGQGPRALRVLGPALPAQQRRRRRRGRSRAPGAGAA